MYLSSLLVKRKTSPMCRKQAQVYELIIGHLVTTLELPCCRCIAKIRLLLAIQMLILLQNHHVLAVNLQCSVSHSSVYGLMIRCITAVSDLDRPCSHSQPQDYITGFSHQTCSSSLHKIKKKRRISYCFILLSPVCNFLPFMSLWNSSVFISFCNPSA